MQGRSRPGWRRYDRLTRAAGLFVLAPALLLLALPRTADIAHVPWFGMAVRNLQVAALEDPGPAATAGLEAGDRLREVNGLVLNTPVDWFVAIGPRPLPSPLRLVVERDNRFLAVDLPWSAPPRSREIWAMSQYLSGFAFLMIGWWVLWRRRDPIARDFCGLCCIFAFFLMEVWAPPTRGWITAREGVNDLAQLLLPPLFLRFCLAFPALGPLSADQARLRRLVLLPALPLAALSLYALLARLDPRDSPVVTVVQVCAFVYLFACFVAGLVIFARKALRRDRPVQQTKLKVVLLGLLVGLLPFLVGMVWSSFFPRAALPHREWLGFSLALVPLTFGLAILRYGALDKRFVVRHGLTYGTLTLLLVLAYVALVWLLGSVLTAGLGVDGSPIRQVVVAVCALAAVPARRAVQRLIDRTFFPDRRESHAAVAEVGREMNGLIDTQAAAATLVARLAELFGARRVSLFLADARAGELVEAAGREAAGEVPPVYRVAMDGALPRAVSRAGRPLFAEELGEAEVAGDAEGARVLLDQLGGELLVPLASGGRVTGLVVMGPRRGGSLYTQDDVANLQLLAIHAAAQLENTRLYQESLARERFETELSVAQEIQARLVPDRPLELPGLRLLGRMETSREVGGDYFDYFPLPGDRVGLAIADASGKGIPAALLMTQLRVAFRSEAARGLPPEAVMARLNDTACGHETCGHLVAFYYGVYEVEAGRLQFCNAGMNPPLLFRHDRPRAEELRRGGPVLGAAPGCAYRRGTVRLDPGDLLLLFTDGLTDETNADGEFFDLDRLIQAVRANLSRPLETVREEIFATVSAFGGVERADDRTLMLLQVNPF